MLATADAIIHIECQFHLKGGEFLLDSATPNPDGGVHMVFTSMSGGSDRTSDVTAEGMDEEMWNLTQCNFPGEHV